MSANVPRIAPDRGGYRPTPETRSGWGGAISVAGRSFLRVLGTAGAGLLAGLAYGAIFAYWTTTVGPKAPNGNWADFETILTWLASLMIYGVIGFVAGLLVGLVVLMLASIVGVARARRTADRTQFVPRSLAHRQPGPRIIDFAEIPGVPCPCGTARRAFADVPESPGTIHVTEISLDAKRHYHKSLTETYYVLECEEDARMQLDDEIIPVRPGVCVMIPPGVRHRAIGRMKVLIVVFPKFDPADEWLD